MSSHALKLDPSKATVSSSDKSSTAKISNEQIAKRAYELWMERGCLAGTDEENWLFAENELRTKLGVQAA